MLNLLLMSFVAIGVESNVRMVRFEGNDFPENVGWERIQFLECDRSLNGGWFEHHCGLGTSQGPLGEQDYYQRSLAEFANTSTFFIEWRVQTDVPSVLFDKDGIATVLSSSGTSGTNYHFTMTNDRVRLFRDTSLPIVFVDIEQTMSHTYRIELNGTELYAWYIDSRLVDFGLPEGAYPSNSSFLIWGTRHNVYENTARWDYIRFGVIPVDASGDYNSDGLASLDDFYFIHECLTNDRPGIKGGPGNDAGPGCRFTDFDGDADVDLRDIAVFQEIYANPS